MTATSLSPAAGGGSLILDDSAKDYANISGFGVGDTIDLRDFAFSASTTIDAAKSGFGSLDAGLILTNGAADSAPVYFEGDYTSATLAAEHLKPSFASDGHAIGSTGKFGTAITLVST